ncbi:MAG: tRNA pseudouridine(55) synthase TruB [Omnitrophica bacterium RIFCSPLOWO2_12_FULL_50_11]|nr:MAG: tRNA pseudouridine(55) synthase TruB [Omnitrophica bacterium RIFCSPLOWO2_12_FULL_50_11]
MNLDGILVVDKDRGWTSHDVCAFVRSRFHIRKVGHAGTLDPLATGVLVLLLGKMTRRSQEFSSCDKEYYGTLRLGLQTDSHDVTGNVIARSDAWRSITKERLEQGFQKFTGVLEQTPPMVSALKHGGIRLYRLARAGKTVDRPKRTVIVHEFRIEEICLPEVRFYARVSKGTYLRTLAHDMGEFLGTFGVLSELRRVASGIFSLEEAVTIDELKRLGPQELPTCVKGPVSVPIVG